jgi:hypothetical protein
MAHETAMIPVDGPQLTSPSRELAFERMRAQAESSSHETTHEGLMEMRKAQTEG